MSMPKFLDFETTEGRALIELFKWTPRPLIMAVDIREMYLMHGNGD